MSKRKARVNSLFDQASARGDVAGRAIGNGSVSLPPICTHTPAPPPLPRRPSDRALQPAFERASKVGGAPASRRPLAGLLEDVDAKHLARLMARNPMAESHATLSFQPRPPPQRRPTEMTMVSGHVRFQQSCLTILCSRGLQLDGDDPQRRGDRRKPKLMTRGRSGLGAKYAAKSWAWPRHIHASSYQLLNSKLPPHSWNGISGVKDTSAASTGMLRAMRARTTTRRLGGKCWQRPSTCVRRLSCAIDADCSPVVNGQKLPKI